MKKEFFIIGMIGLILGILLVGGCEKPQLVGNDTDEHGCKASAGYSWCEAKQKCLRTWEENCTSECGTCPQLSPPAPSFCEDGTIIAGSEDECGCQGPPRCEPKGNTQIANPASAYCEEQGGTVDIRNDLESEGQVGICILPGGVECEEWAYFRGNCPESTDGKLKANDCTEPRTQACTKEYMPVCGWFNLSIECANPPCKAVYGNRCTACADSKVAYWIDGECQ